MDTVVTPHRIYYICTHIYIYIYNHICVYIYIFNIYDYMYRHDTPTIIITLSQHGGAPGVALARYLNDVWRSDDGLTWRCVASSARWAPRAAAATATVGATVVLAGGRGEEGALGAKDLGVSIAMGVPQ